MALQDLLTSALKEDGLKVTVERIYNMAVGSDNASLEQRSRGLKPTKNLIEVYSLIKEAIEHYESRENIPNENKILFTEEMPDKDLNTEIITFSIAKRVPGTFGQASPFNGKVKNLMFREREEREDKNNPGYRIITMGKWFDNRLRLTTWALTNKRANYRANWLEDMMDEYQWWFAAQGVSRMIFEGRGQDLVLETTNNKWYGRPLDFFVRTEKIREISQKALEEIVLKITNDE